MKIFILLLAISLAGCSKNTETSAAIAVAGKFYDALMKNDIKTARQYILDKENLLDDGTTSFLFSKYTFSKISIINEQAFISTSLKGKSKPSIYSTVLTKKNGTWNILIKKTMINMFRSAVQNDDVSMEITDIKIESK